MLSHPHRSTAPGASRGGGCLERAGLLESIFVPANPAQFHNSCCKNRFEFDPGAAGGKYLKAMRRKLLHPLQKGKPLVSQGGRGVGEPPPG